MDSSSLHVGFKVPSEQKCLTFKTKKEAVGVLGLKLPVGGDAFKENAPIPSVTGKCKSSKHNVSLSPPKNKTQWYLC